MIIWGKYLLSLKKACVSIKDSFNKCTVLFKLIWFWGEIRPKIHLCAFIVNLKIIVIGISVAYINQTIYLKTIEM